jgi:hypothetical protein
MTGKVEQEPRYRGMLLSFSFEEGLSHTFYPLLPDSFTQNQNIIDGTLPNSKKLLDY